MASVKSPIQVATTNDTAVVPSTDQTTTLPPGAGASDSQHWIGQIVLMLRSPHSLYAVLVSANTKRRAKSAALEILPLLVQPLVMKFPRITIEPGRLHG